MYNRIGGGNDHWNIFTGNCFDFNPWT